MPDSHPHPHPASAASPAVEGIALVALVARHGPLLAYWRPADGRRPSFEPRPTDFVDQVDPANPANPADPDAHGHRVSGLSRETFARVFAYYKPLMCDRPMDVCIDRTRFIGYPTIVRDNAQSSSPATSVLRSFNVVVALARQTADPGLVVAAQRAVRAVAAALNYEQTRENYLSAQLAIFKYSTAAAAAAGQRQPTSTLADTLDQLLAALQARRPVSILVNGWVEISVPPADPAPADLIALSRTAIQPYQTFLPFIEDPKRRGLALPAGSTDTLQRLVRLANPLRSFSELQTDLDLPIATLVRAAAHLVRWNLGKVIDKVSKSSVYIVSQTADLGVDSKTRKDFELATSRLSSDWSFYSFLFSFSRPLTLEAHHRRLNGNMQLMHEMTTCTIWLLRVGYLIQIRTFVYLNMPDIPPDTCLELHRQLTVRNRPNDDVELIWLVDYFNGQHHLEDIMWREDVSRTRLEQLLENNKDVLVSCLHE